MPPTPGSAAPPPTRRGEFLAGCRDELPILLGVAPFGMIYGILALSAGLPPPAAQAMSSVVFAGSAQFITAQLIRDGAPGAVIVLTVFVVNLRHALYSASLAPYLRHLNGWWKALLAYLLTDEAYAVAVTRYARDGERTDVSPWRHWYFLGAGLTLWASWQVSTAVGVFLGAVVPESWSLDFTLPLTFIALVFPALRDRAGVAAALTAGLVALLALGLPFKLGLIVAAAAGIAAGMFAEARS
ncbi:MAG: AzlC family ABC transporter permease [Deltaproteobacteria bacterium]|nr:AzlC family ABC transporter permease [Deltaproteobacteria bacterium]